MKKIFLASTALTALVATTGVAVAQVSFGGYGRFGAAYRENRSNTFDDGNGNMVTQSTSDLALVSRFRLNIDGKAVTDGGVEFSARVRLQADDNPNLNEQSAAGLNGARYTVAYGGLRVDAGNVGGFIDNMANYYGNEPGLEAFTGQYVGNDYGFLGYSSTGAGSNAVYVSYTAGGFTAGASYDPMQAFNPAAGATSANSTERWDIGASYNFNNFTLAAAYGETTITGASNQSMFVVTFGADFDRWGITALVGDEDLGAGNQPTEGTFYGLSASFDLGTATTLVASFGDGDGNGDTQSFGLGAKYDLGGGVSIRGGIGSTKVGNGNSQTVGDLGVLFNF
ncbi:MAG: porin [Marinibacterium sp.]